jgi:hypothetical protein
LGSRSLPVDSWLIGRFQLLAGRFCVCGLSGSGCAGWGASGMKTYRMRPVCERVAPRPPSTGRYEAEYKGAEAPPLSVNPDWRRHVRMRPNRLIILRSRVQVAAALQMRCPTGA